MDDELSRNYWRWRQAEESGRDDEAEAAFRATFASAVDPYDVRSDFAARTMKAVAAAAAQDAHRARRTRAAALWAGAGGSVVVAYFGAGIIGSVAASALAGLLNLLVRTVVGITTAVQGGASVWSLVTSLGRAAEAFAANPTVTVTMIAIQVVAVAAIVALQRLLGSDWESFK